jgi:ATP-dependent protease Clp ATPase subunit
VSRSAGLLTRSFCGNSQKQVKKLIAAPHARICDGCVSRAHAVLADPGQPMTSAGGTAVVCDECLDLCDEIVTDEPPERR